MLNNNSARLAIWLTLSDKYDIERFNALCQEAGVATMENIEFGQKVGMLELAKWLNKDMDYDSAYRLLMNIPTKNSHPVPQAAFVGSCCGGGEVL